MVCDVTLSQGDESNIQEPNIQEHVHSERRGRPPKVSDVTLSQGEGFNMTQDPIHAPSIISTASDQLQIGLCSSITDQLNNTCEASSSVDRDLSPCPFCGKLYKRVNTHIT